MEDAPTGIRSGKAAGCFVLATCTSHSRKSLEKEKPDFLVDDLSQVVARRTADGVVLFITQPAGRGYPDSAFATPVDTVRLSFPLSNHACLCSLLLFIIIAFAYTHHLPYALHGEARPWCQIWLPDVFYGPNSRCFHHPVNASTSTLFHVTSNRFVFKIIYLFLYPPNPNRRM